MRDLRQPFLMPGATPGEDNGTTLPETVAHLRDVAVHVDGTFVATVQIQGRLHPSLGFVNLGSPITTPGIVAVTLPVSDLQLVVTGYGSGTIKAYVAGFNVQI